MTPSTNKLTILDDSIGSDFPSESSMDDFEEDLTPFLSLSCFFFLCRSNNAFMVPWIVV